MQVRAALWVVVDKDVPILGTGEGAKPAVFVPLLGTGRSHNGDWRSCFRPVYGDDTSQKWGRAFVF